ncbi:hypothetical protein BV898_20148, partial [Hypsibius exemplaris]
KRSIHKSSTALHPRHRLHQGLLPLHGSSLRPFHPFVHERILWSLFETLYGEADVAELRLCQKFETWLKDTLGRPPTGLPTALEDIPAHAGHEGHLRGGARLSPQDAVDIALHFGLYDQAATILALWMRMSSNRAAATVQDAVGDYLDEVMQTVQDGDGGSRKYWIKALMILSEVAYLNKCAHMDIFSLWDILRKYEDHAAANPHCALPGQASASSSNPPSFLYSMMTHYCRHSRPQYDVQSRLRPPAGRPAFDVRVRWFVMRLFSLTGTASSRPLSSPSTADFARRSTPSATHTSRSLRCSTFRRAGRGITKSAPSLCRWCAPAENPNVYDSIMEFLRNDLHVAAADIESIKATLALRRGDKLTAFTHFYHAGSEEPCVELMRTFILPLNGVVDRDGLFRRPRAIGVLSDSTVPAGCPSWVRFFELLRVLEDGMKTEEDPVRGDAGDGGGMSGCGRGWEALPVCRFSSGREGYPHWMDSSGRKLRTRSGSLFHLLVAWKEPPRRETPLTERPSSLRDLPRRETFLVERPFSSRWSLVFWKLFFLV